jgi:hypothetical protein
MWGYKHTKQAIEKMKSRFVNKVNQPMFGKLIITISRDIKSGKLFRGKFYFREINN